MDKLPVGLTEVYGLLQENMILQGILESIGKTIGMEQALLELTLDHKFI